MTAPDKDILYKIREVMMVYGSAIERWPPEQRALYDPVIAESMAAQRLISATRALEEAMFREEAVDGDQSAALTEKIMLAAAQARIREERHQLMMVGVEQIRAAPRRKPVPAPVRQLNTWLPVTALAASLIVGLILGAQDIPGLTTTPDTSSELEAGDLAFGIDGASEEDVL